MMVVVVGMVPIGVILVGIDTVVAVVVVGGGDGIGVVVVMIDVGRLSLWLVV